MRKLYLLAFSLASSLPLMGAYRYCIPPFEYTLTADYAYLRRAQIRDFGLALNAGNKKPVLTAGDLVDRMKWKSAIRGAFSFYLDEKRSIELLYTYIYPWKETRTVTGNLSFPFSGGPFALDFQHANLVSAFYETQIQNGEINYWKHLTPERVNYFAFAWNLGFRFIYLKDHFDLAYTKLLNTSHYRINTLNLLFGAQLGANLDWNPVETFTWSLRVKGAAFYDEGKIKVFLGDFNDTTVRRNFTRHRGIPSFLFEGFGQLAYHITSNLDFHAGYQGTLLTGLLLAPMQRDRTTLDRKYLNDDGQVVIHGGFAGLQLNF